MKEFIATCDHCGRKYKDDFFAADLSLFSAGWKEVSFEIVLPNLLTGHGTIADKRTKLLCPSCYDELSSLKEKHKREEEEWLCRAKTEGEEESDPRRENRNPD